MAIIKTTFQLVNFENQVPLDIRLGEGSNPDDYLYVDWSLDGNGNIRMISKQDAQVQSTLKCLFTEKQPNGYGTSIYTLIGEKDIVVRRISLFMDITVAMIVLKSFIDAQAVKQNLNPEDLISTLGRLVVTEDAVNPSISKCSLTLITQDQTSVPIGVL